MERILCDVLPFLVLRLQLHGLIQFYSCSCIDNRTVRFCMLRLTRSNCDKMISIFLRVSLPKNSLKFNQKCYSVTKINTGIRFAKKFSVSGLKFSSTHSSGGIILKPYHICKMLNKAGDLKLVHSPFPKFSVFYCFHFSPRKMTGQILNHKLQSVQLFTAKQEFNRRRSSSSYFSRAKERLTLSDFFWPFFVLRSGVCLKCGSFSQKTSGERLSLLEHYLHKLTDDKGVLFTKDLSLF